MEGTSNSEKKDSTEELKIEQLFSTKRCEDEAIEKLSFFYLPIGLILLIIRVFVGFHTFIVACILRKSAAIRARVLRLMCAVLGIVVIQKGERDPSARVICSNHVSVLDHLAIDLLSPCLLPSIWDIPSTIRWCFGYVDLGASQGRPQLVRNAKEIIKTGDLPLLAFPEGVITSGKKALLKFNAWCFEIDDSIQPVAIVFWRPYPWNLAASLISSSWWSDIIYFFALPFTVIKVNYLSKVERREEESIDDFSARVSNIIALELGIVVSKFDSRDVAEAARRMIRDNQTEKYQKPVTLNNTRQMDECAMRIKKSFPSFHLAVIRNDLEKTKSQLETTKNLKNGKLPKEFPNSKENLDAGHWKKLYDDRKWRMIEINRRKYMQKDD